MRVCALIPEDITTAERNRFQRRVGQVTKMFRQRIPEGLEASGTFRVRCTFSNRIDLMETSPFRCQFDSLIVHEAYASRIKAFQKHTSAKTVIVLFGKERI